MSLGVDVEAVYSSNPAENDPWKVGERKISSCCDVAVFTTERESGVSSVPVDTGKRGGLLNRA